MSKVILFKVQFFTAPKADRVNNEMRMYMALRPSVWQQLLRGHSTAAQASGQQRELPAELYFHPGGKTAQNENTFYRHTCHAEVSC